MYTQFFGNYLLANGYVTRDQLFSAMRQEADQHMKLGTLALHAGYMNAAQVDDVVIHQTHQDNRFGELAIQLGYLTEAQVEELLKQRILYQNKFLLLTAADGIACVLILIGVSFWSQEIAFFHAAHFFYADVLRGKRLKSDTGCHDWEEQEVENGSCHGISVDVLNTGAVYDDLKRHRSDREHGALDNRWNGEGQIFFQRCRRTEDK